MSQYVNTSQFELIKFKLQFDWRIVNQSDFSKNYGIERSCSNQNHFDFIKRFCFIIICRWELQFVDVSDLKWMKQCSMIRNMCCFILFEFYLFLLVLLLLAKERKRSDVSWRVAKYGDHTLNFCSAFNPSKWTNTHTHHEHKPGAVGSHLCSGTRWAFGVRCLAQGSHLSRGIEGGLSAGHSLPPPTIPAGPETWTRNLWVTSPTLYPLGHDRPAIWGLKWK